MKQKALLNKLGEEELIGLLTEECCEAGQASQKVRRAMHGTTPVSIEDAKNQLNEEITDILVCVEMLIDTGLLKPDKIHKIAMSKVDRWFSRTFLLE